MPTLAPLVRYGLAAILGLILIVGCDTPTVSDRETLIALYNATDGENWERNHNWLSDVPFDSSSGASLS